MRGGYVYDERLRCLIICFESESTPCFYYLVELVCRFVVSYWRDMMLAEVFLMTGFSIVLTFFDILHLFSSKQISEVICKLEVND